jgi:hypothetical protein
MDYSAHMVRGVSFMKEAGEALKVKNWSRASFFLNEAHFEISEARKWISENTTLDQKMK